MVACTIHGDGSAALQYRSETGGSVAELKFAIRNPDEFQLEKKGNTYIMSVAHTGGPFETQKLADFDIGTDVKTGLFVCSHDDRYLEEVEFSNVDLFDGVLAPECLTVPTIDGIADDACWASASWQAIDQVWIPWGGSMDADDFKGRYKVTWSSETDRMYFLVEVVDDVLVEGYKYPMDGYYNWDVVEIFFDEDASGGDHKFNQNAFAYHITAGNDDADFEAMDLGANGAVMYYSDHLECKIVQDGGVYTWEISMIVYNEDYDPNSSTNSSEQLEAGKVSGLSIAYCDNDNPDENPKTRDNFIGSVKVPQANYNDHWMNADWFGKVQLVAADYPSSVADLIERPTHFLLDQNYPNPFNPSTTIGYTLNTPGHVSLDIYNLNGQLIRNLVNGYYPSGAYSISWNVRTDTGFRTASGVYYYQLRTGDIVEKRKMLLLQ